MLKSARLYKLDHERTAAQFGDAWNQLRGALTGTGEAGILLGISGKHRAEVFFREAPPPAPGVGFEIVDIELKERSKLRTLLSGLPAPSR